MPLMQFLASTAANKQDTPVSGQPIASTPAVTQSIVTKSHEQNPFSSFVVARMS